MSERPQGSSSSSRIRSRIKCPLPREPAGTGSSSTPWSTTPPLWAPGSTSSVRPQTAFWMEAWTAAPGRRAKRRLRPRRQKPLPATNQECDTDYVLAAESRPVWVCICTICLHLVKYMHYSSVPSVKIFTKSFLNIWRFRVPPVLFMFSCLWGPQSPVWWECLCGTDHLVNTLKKIFFLNMYVLILG